MALDKVDQISLPGGESGPLEEGEGLSGTSSLGQGRLKGVTLSPIIVHSLKTDEPEFYFFLVEWGPDDGNPDNILREAIPGSKVVGKQQYVSHPYKIIDCIRGEWYRFRVSTVNKYGWRSGTLPIPPAGPEADDEANYWVYQRAGFDEDDLVRLDEATNILPNSDFEFDTLENGSLELPYWQYKVNGTWADCFHNVGPIERGIFGRLTAPHLILKPGGYIRSAIVDMYKDRPYALSGFFVQDVLGRGNLTFRIAYYDASDNFLDHDYVLMGEDGIRVIDSTTWVGGSVFETRDRCGTVFFPPLKSHQLIGKKGLARLEKTFILARLVEGIGRIAFIKTDVPVIPDKIYRAETAVPVNLPNNTAKTVTGIRRSTRMCSVTVKTKCKKTTVRSYIKAHSLMHHRRRTFGDMDCIRFDFR